jgi:hypothetical protein
MLHAPFAASFLDTGGRAGYQAGCRCRRVASSNVLDWQGRHVGIIYIVRRSLVTTIHESRTTLSLLHYIRHSSGHLPKRTDTNSPRRCNSKEKQERTSHGCSCFSVLGSFGIHPTYLQGFGYRGSERGKERMFDAVLDAPMIGTRRRGTEPKTKQGPVGVDLDLDV